MRGERGERERKERKRSLRGTSIAPNFSISSGRRTSTIKTPSPESNLLFKAAASINGPVSAIVFLFSKNEKQNFQKKKLVSKNERRKILPPKRVFKEKEKKIIKNLGVFYTQFFFIQKAGKRNRRKEKSLFSLTIF